ncbi:MAG TPA: rhomboid family intramembrane serine protease [Rhodospirillaceae bacterium]|nr:rhomboid family intramembrane serine protease [Rhodospirillaceae bacterium]
MFTIPVADDNPTEHPAFVTWAIMALCLLAFLWQQSLPADAAQSLALSLGMVPAVLSGQAELAPELVVLPPWATLLTSMFLHGGWLHLAGNMLFLWIFGDNVEDAMGHGRFLAFYLAAGIAAALAQATAAPAAEVPMIGASGAIAGVLAGYLLLYPKANVRVLVVILLFIRLVNVPAMLVLGLWFLAQIGGAAMSSPEAGGVAFWAHVGGFLCGGALLPLFKHRDMRLFSAPQSQAFAVSPARLARRGRVPTVIPKDGM